LPAGQIDRRSALQGKPATAPQPRRSTSRRTLAHIDHRRWFKPAVPAVDDEVHLALQAFAYRGGLGLRHIPARQNEGRAHQRFAQLGEQRLDDGMIGHAYPDGLAFRVLQAPRHLVRAQ
jgi:hypothetical protein